MGKIVFDSDFTTHAVFAVDPYFFHMFRGKPGKMIYMRHLSSLTIYAFKSSFNLNGMVLHEGDAAQIENMEVVLDNLNADTEIMVAGVLSSYTTQKSITITKSTKIYRVSKPWGYELWFNGEHPLYAFKQVFILRNQRTSLQYHKFKHETNVLFSGIAKWHYSEELSPLNIHTEIISPITSTNIYPNTVHRVEALMDVVFYEVSTPHLDDVFRLEDDTNRTDGRIQSEHGVK